MVSKLDEKINKMIYGQLLAYIPADITEASQEDALRQHEDNIKALITTEVEAFAERLTKKHIEVDTDYDAKVPVVTVAAIFAELSRYRKGEL